MRPIILISLLATALGNLQEYSLPGHSGGGSAGVGQTGQVRGNLGSGFSSFGGSRNFGGGFASAGGSEISVGDFSSDGGSGSLESENFDIGGIESIGTGFEGSCSQGQVLNVHGKCVEPEISREIYLINAPLLQVDRRSDPIEAPKPKLKYNIVFVRTPKAPEGSQPTIVPPPQQKTIVYVLNKDEEADGPQLIEIPEGPAHKPEVYYLNYKDGDNPQLPIGIDLQSALSNAINQDGQSIKGIRGSLSGSTGEVKGVLTRGEIGDREESLSVSHLGDQKESSIRSQFGTQEDGYAGDQFGGQEGSTAGGQGGGYSGSRFGDRRQEFTENQFGSQGSDSTEPQLRGQGSGHTVNQLGGQGSGHAVIQLRGQGSGHTLSQLGGQGGLNQGGRVSGVDTHGSPSAPSDLYNAPRFR